MDERHRRPDGVSDEIVGAAGKLSEAVEWVERARGHLYEFHQLMGRADFLFEEAADRLADAGQVRWAERLRSEVIGRNVIEGRWTFQLVEEFDDRYWECVRTMEAEVRDDLMAGRRHVHEAELKEARRTTGRRHHEATPDELATRGG